MAEDDSSDPTLRDLQIEEPPKKLMMNQTKPAKDLVKTPPHENIQEDNPRLTATEDFRDGVNERIEDETHI